RTPSVALIVFAGWAMLGPWAVGYPFTPSANDKMVRALALAIVVGCSGFHLAFVGTSRVPSLICLLFGILMMISAFAFPHDLAKITANELFTGAAIVVAAVLTLNLQHSRPSG